MNGETMAAAMIAAKLVPGSAAARAEAAAQVAVTAADSVTTATVAETKSYLNIT
jgi:hypothetical protein